MNSNYFERKLLFELNLHFFKFEIPFKIELLFEVELFFELELHFELLLDFFKTKYCFTGLPKQRLLGRFERYFVSHETGFRPENCEHN